MEFERVYSGAPWEGKVGYCRALRAGQFIYVTGTAPVDDTGGVFASGDAYRQTLHCLGLIETALLKLRASRQNIVRTRLYVTDIQQWAEYGRAHKEFFGVQVPTTSMVEVKGLIAPGMTIEIEVDAISEDPVESDVEKLSANSHQPQGLATASFQVAKVRIADS